MVSSGLSVLRSSIKNACVIALVAVASIACQMQIQNNGADKEIYQAFVRYRTSLAELEASGATDRDRRLVAVGYFSNGTIERTRESFGEPTGAVTEPSPRTDFWTYYLRIGERVAVVHDWTVNWTSRSNPMLVLNATDSNGVCIPRLKLRYVRQGERWLIDAATEDTSRSVKCDSTVVKQRF